MSNYNIMRGGSFSSYAESLPLRHPRPSPIFQPVIFGGFRLARRILHNKKGVNMNFVKIPEGKLITKDKKEFEIKSFEMMDAPVTQDQWQEIMGNNPSHFKGDNNLPVECVSYYDIQKFIKELNKKDKYFEYYLPTQEQWEYACRAGTTTIYPFGDDPKLLNEYAWYSDNSGNRTHPVKQKKPNQWGLYDMLGNVWEWTSSLYE